MNKISIILKTGLLTLFLVQSISLVNAQAAGNIQSHLQQLKVWLNQPNTGSDYINRNLSKSTEAAKKWNTDEQVQEVYFEFSSPSNYKCQFTFSIRTNGEKIAISPCPANTLTLPDEANLNEQKNTQPISGITTSPKIKLRNFVDLMTQDSVLQAELNSMLGSQGAVTSNYRLYLLSGNILIWEAKIKNLTTGKSALIQARANSEHPLFYLKKL